MNKLKTRFWYESNACWGYIETLKDLQEKCKLQTGEFGAVKDVNDFLDRSMQTEDGALNFGTRIEHKGKKSLRKYLTEIKVLDDFLTLMKKD